MFLKVDADQANTDVEVAAMARAPVPTPATLTLGHRERLGDVLAGYGTPVEVDVIRAWWSFRGLVPVRWLAEHGFDPPAPGCEVDVLRAQL